MQGGGAKRYENRPASPAPPQKARTTRGAKSGKRPKWPRAIWKIYMMKTMILLISKRAMSQGSQLWTTRKMYVCDSTEKTASIDRLRYNREQVSNLFFIHENTTQELNRTDICLTTTQPCIGHMSPVIVPKSAMYCSRFAWWLNEASVICRTHCGTQFNWRKAHFSITHSKISPTRDERKISSMRDEWKFCNGELLQ